MSLSAILGGASALGGFLSGMSSNNQYGGNIAEDQNQFNSLISKQQSLFSTLSNLYGTEVGQGDFDPTQRLQTLQNITDHDSQLATGNAAAAAATMGYRAGDSSPLQQINATNNEYKLGEQQQANQIITQEEQMQNQAAEMPAAVNLSGAENALNSNMQFNASQIQNPAGLLGSVMPFLSGLGGSSNASSATSPGAFDMMTAGLNATNPSAMAGILGGAPGMAAAGMSTPMIGAYTPTNNGFALPSYNPQTGGTY